jgi:hypothetical protein
MDQTRLLRLLVDVDRLTVLGQSALGPVEVDELASRLNIPRRRLQRAVGKLREAGILDEDLRLDRAALRTMAESLSAVTEPAGPLVLDGPWTPEERRILANAFTGIRLTRIPAQRFRRRVVLERLAQEFDIGIHYAEKEVNTKLRSFHPDYAALRRYLVDEGFLDRAEGHYWRIGGRVEV